MNANLLIYLLSIVAMIILGFLVSYFKTKTKIKKTVIGKHFIKAQKRNSTQIKDETST